MEKDCHRAVTAARKCGAPETVSVVMAELAEDMREGLLALAVGAAVGAGLPVTAAVMEQDVTAVCRDVDHGAADPKGRRTPRPGHASHIGIDPRAAATITGDPTGTTSATAAIRYRPLRSGVHREDRRRRCTSTAAERS